jgi:glutamate decarboxylase
MVHLGQVTNDSEIQKGKDASSGGIDMSKLGPEGSQPDDFETSIYGSRFAAEDLPRHEMPEKEMPAAIAYRMIKDDLTLDGNPTLKYNYTQPLYTTSANKTVALPRSAQPTWSPKSRSS